MPHTLTKLVASYKKLKVIEHVRALYQDFIRSSKLLIDPTENGFILRIFQDQAKLLTIESGQLIDSRAISHDDLAKYINVHPTWPVGVTVSDVDFKVYNFDLATYKFYEKGLLRSQIQQSEYQKNDWFCMKSVFQSWKTFTTYLYAIRTQPNYQKWLNMLQKAPNPFAGIGVWPIEVALQEKDLISKNQNEIWVNISWLLIVMFDDDQHLYIATFHKGELIFFRNIPKVVFEDIEKEIIHTLTYLKKYGYNDEDKTAITLLDDTDKKFIPNQGTFNFFRQKKLETSAKVSLSFDKSFYFVPGFLKESFLNYFLPPKLMKGLNRLLIAGMVVLFLQLIQSIALYKRNNDESHKLAKAMLKIPVELTQIMREVDLFNMFTRDYPWRLSLYLPAITRAVAQCGQAQKIAYEHSTFSILFKGKGNKKPEALQEAITKNLESISVPSQINIQALSQRMYNLSIKLDHAHKNYKF